MAVGVGNRRGVGAVAACHKALYVGIGSSHCRRAPAPCPRPEKLLTMQKIYEPVMGVQLKRWKSGRIGDDNYGLQADIACHYENSSGVSIADALARGKRTDAPFTRILVTGRSLAKFTFSLWQSAVQRSSSIVRFNAAIIKETHQRSPVAQAIADCLRHG